MCVETTATLCYANVVNKSAAILEAAGVKLRQFSPVSLPLRANPLRQHAADVSIQPSNGLIYLQGTSETPAK